MADVLPDEMCLLRLLQWDLFAYVRTDILESPILEVPLDLEYCGD